MSYEYRLVLADERVCQHVIHFVKSSACYVEQQDGSIHVKDWSVNNGAAYDARVFQEDDCALWLEVNLRSPVLYELLKAAIGDELYKCLEDGDLDNEVSLHDALGLKGARVKSE